MLAIRLGSQGHRNASAGPMQLSGSANWCIPCHANSQPWSVCSGEPFWRYRKLDPNFIIAMLNHTLPEEACLIISKISELFHLRLPEPKSSACEWAKRFAEPSPATVCNQGEDCLCC